MGVIAFLLLLIFFMNRPLHMCIETWNVEVVKKWVEVASQEDIDEAIDISSPNGTALCMAAALKKTRENGNFHFINYIMLLF